MEIDECIYILEKYLKDAKMYANEGSANPLSAEWTNSLLCGVLAVVKQLDGISRQIGSF